MALLNKADTVFVGATPIDKVYRGAALVWDSSATDTQPSYPAASTFSESFDTLDPAKWTVYTGATAESGELVLAASSSYSTIRTKELFSVEGSAVRIQLNGLPNTDNGSTQTWIDFRIDASNYVSLFWSNGTLFCRMMLANVQTDTEILFDPATMQLWRLRETAGSLYWETSSDGLTWTSHRTALYPTEWVGKGGQISLVAGNWNSASTPGQAKFDNLNVDDFTETFTASDASAWSVDRWNLSPLQGAATDIMTNAGRLSIPDTDGAMIRMIAKAPVTTNQNLLMSYTITDTSARTWIQVWLRGDGTWSGNKPGSGYAVEISTDSSRVSILKYKASTQTGLAATDGVNSLTAGQKQWLRFEANETTLRYRIWADGTAEPTTWTASVTDADLVGPGHFQVCAYRSTANVGAKTIYFDDIALNERVTKLLSDPVDPGTGVVTNEQFDGSYNLTFSNNGSHPHLWLEWSGILPATISGGTIKISKNTSSSTDKGFHRMFSRIRYGGPGKSIRFRYRARMTALYDDGGWGGYRGVKIGMKFPQAQSITGISEDDPRSADSKYKPGSMIFVNGIMEDGRTELARNGYGDAGYMPFIYGPKIPYTINTWKDMTIQVDWVPLTTEVRIRYWQNADGSGTPIFDYTDPDSVFQEPGFIWYRTDFSDFEYDYMIVEEV